MCPRKKVHSLEKVKKKMKQTYFSPELKVVELNLQAAILMESGGGIKDDGSVNTGEGGSTNPSEDYGW